MRIRRAIGGVLILVSTFTGAVSDPTLDYRYLFADHLGSVEVITDQTGVPTATIATRCQQVAFPISEAVRQSHAPNTSYVNC